VLKPRREIGVDAVELHAQHARAALARVLRVKLNGINADFATRLQHALAAHRGGATPVRISYHNAEGQAEIELGAEWRVRATPALKDSLQALDGVIAAELVFG